MVYDDHGSDKLGCTGRKKFLFPVAYCAAPVLESPCESRSLRKRSSVEWPGVLGFTVLSFLVMGYHPGLEDDGVYLTAVKARLNPALYPHDAAFFKLQMQASAFDDFMAYFVRWTQMPLAWAELLWQLASLFLILWASKKILNLLFRERAAQWAGVAMVAAMFTLPVAGSALYLADQHLHPRNLATALILLAVWRILAGKRWEAATYLLAAFLFHPLMTVFGLSLCAFLTLATLDPLPLPLRAIRASSFALIPLRWVFEPADRLAQGRRNAELFLSVPMDLVRMAGCTGATGSLRALVEFCQETRRDTPRAMCRSRVLLWPLSAGVGHAPAFAFGSGATHAFAAHALPADRILSTHDAGWRNARPIPAQEECLALGAVSPAHQCIDVYVAARRVERRPSPRVARPDTFEPLAAGVRVDSFQYPRRRVFRSRSVLS